MLPRSQWHWTTSTTVLRVQSIVASGERGSFELLCLMPEIIDQPLVDNLRIRGGSTEVVSLMVQIESPI